MSVEQAAGVRAGPTAALSMVTGDVILRPIVLLAIFIVALLPLFSTPLLPFIDLYNHLARYFILSTLKTDLVLQQDYASNWNLLPNVGLDVLGTAMTRSVPPAWSAHLLVTLLFAVQYGGVLAFNRALTGRTSIFVALLIVPLLYSFILNWGFANFLFGLGLVFASAAWWVARRNRLAVALPIACLLVVIIFFTHGLCFALYGILVASLEVGRVWSGTSRRPADFVLALIPIVIQAVVPVIMFVLAPTSSTPGGLSNAGSSIARLATHGGLAERLWELFRYRILTIVQVAEGPWLWLDVVIFITLIAIIAMLIARGRATLVRVTWPAIAAGVLLVILTPPALFGVGYVADRMPLFLALLFVGSLDVPRRRDKNRSALLVIGALVVVRLAAIAIGWQGYAADYADFKRIALMIPPRSLIYDIMVGGSPRDSTSPRCAMYRPLLIRDYHQIGPLFADGYKQPLQLVGRLQAAMTALPRGFAAGNNRPGYDDEVVARAGPAGFDFLLVCQARLLSRTLPVGVTVAAQTPHLTLLDLRRTHR